MFLHTKHGHVPLAPFACHAVVQSGFVTDHVAEAGEKENGTIAGVNGNPGILEALLCHEEEAQQQAHRMRQASVHEFGDRHLEDGHGQPHIFRPQRALQFFEAEVHARALATQVWPQDIARSDVVLVEEDVPWSRRRRPLGPQGGPHDTAKCRGLLDEVAQQGLRPKDGPHVRVGLLDQSQWQRHAASIQKDTIDLIG